MSKLFLLRPEVAGGWGPRTIIRNQDDLDAGRAQVPDVSHLEYVFEGWLGDALLESFPCFIVTDRLAEAISSSRMTGARFESVEVSLSSGFRDRHPGIELPRFLRLMPEGSVDLDDERIASWSGHDICRTPRAELVVTAACQEVMSRFGIHHCEVTELAPPV